MKYSFMSFSTPALTLAEMLSLAKELGYDGVEPRIDAGHAHEVEVATPEGRRKELRDQAADSGISLCCVATSCKVADPSSTEQTVSDLRARIDLAGDVGAPAIRIFGGSFGQDVSRQGAIDSAGSTLRIVAEQARQRGVTLCFETHDAWCDPSHVAAVLKKVDHPAVAVNWDIMHPVRMGLATIDESFEILQPWIRHIHVHDGRTEAGKLTLLPIGQGEIDHRRAIELLMRAGYGGYLSGEWIKWEAYEAHLPRELATMKGYEEELA